MPERPKIVTRHLIHDDVHTIQGYRGCGGYGQLQRALQELSPDDIIAEVKESGLRGRGGAGFPAGVKWGFIDKSTDKPIYLVINSDESEPGTFKDRLVITRLPHQLIEGALITCYALGVRQAFIYIRGEYAAEARGLNRAIAEAREAGFIGQQVAGTDFEAEITVYRGAGAYICGEETALLNSLEGKKGYPRIKPPFPAAVGLYGCPTVVNNVETLATVPWIIEHGGDEYKKIGSEKSTGTRLACVSGPVEKPGVHEVPLGIPLRELIDFDCGGMREGYRLKGVIPGGASTNILTPEEVERCTLDFESMAEFGTFLGSGATVVVDESISIVGLAYSVAHFFGHESCGQCTPCREGTGWLARLVSRIMAGEGKIEDLDLIDRVAGNITGNTICPLGDAAAAPMIAFVSKYRDEWEEFIRSGERLEDPAALMAETSPAADRMAAASA